MKNNPYMLPLAAMRLLLIPLFVVAVTGQILGQTFTDASGKAMQNPFLNYDKFIGTQFPVDQLTGLSGTHATLKTYAGKPVWVNFWFTACPPCIDEIPALNRLKAKYKDRVIFVSVTFNDRQKVEKLIEKHPFDFVHYINARKLIDKLGIDTYPVSFLIDRNGTIRSVLGPIPSNDKGESDETIYEPVLQKML